MGDEAERYAALETVARVAAASAGEKRTGAGFRRGKSPQDYRTPKVLLDAVRAKFGFDDFDWDLAATRDNSAAEGCYYGPDNALPAHRDALALDWAIELREMLELWLNPPFAQIAPWAAKCFQTLEVWRAGGVVESPRIHLLIPASVGANWWRAYVHKKALVYFLNGRIKFDGKNGFPKDCALAVYAAGIKPGYRCWRWPPKRHRKGSPQGVGP